MYLKLTLIRVLTQAFYIINDELKIISDTKSRSLEILRNDSAEVYSKVVGHAVIKREDLNL